jgi:hypothetical protein
MDRVERFTVLTNAIEVVHARVIMN